jgi:hypothetical protein
MKKRRERKEKKIENKIDNQLCSIMERSYFRASSLLLPASTTSRPFERYISEWIKARKL